MRLGLEPARRLRTGARFPRRRHGRSARRDGLDHGFSRRALARKQILDLIAGEGLEFKKSLRQRLEIVALLGQDALRVGVAGLNQAPDLAVDLAARFFGKNLHVAREHHQFRPGGVEQIQ